MRSVISERGGNASRAGREAGMEKSKRARRRKLDTAKAELEPLLAILWRAGCPSSEYRKMESEGHEEKYRAVIDGGCPADEPVGQRWDKVEPALWRRRRSHSPTAPRCLRTARYGRTVRDLRRTGRVSGRHRSKRTYKRERNGERCTVSSRAAEKYQKHGESHVTGQPATEMGRGRQPTKMAGRRKKTSEYGRGGGSVP